MTEWRTFDTPPDDGQNILIVINPVGCGLRYIGNVRYNVRVHRRDCYPFWMPAPPLPDEAPKPKFEVPQDGLSYLCWVENYGMKLVFWYEAFYSYFVLGHSAATPEDDIHAYMDRDGNWVKRDD